MVRTYSKVRPDESNDTERNDDESLLSGKPLQRAHLAKNKATHLAKNKARRSGAKTCLCRTLICATLLSALLLVTVGICGYAFVSREVREWTVTEPGPSMPIIEVPKEELEVFKDQAKLFWDLLQTDTVPSNLVVSQRELNGLKSESTFLRGHTFTELETNKVTTDISLPMDGFPGGWGRYLVGTQTKVWDPESSEFHAKMYNGDTEKTLWEVKFHLSRLDDGTWNLVLLHGQFLEWAVPQSVIDEKVDLLEGLYNCEDGDDDCLRARNVLDRLSDIELKKGEIVISTRGKANRRALVEDKQASFKPGWKFQQFTRALSLLRS